MSGSTMIIAMNLLRRLSWRKPKKQVVGCGRTHCGTLAVYSGYLKLRPEILIELEAGGRSKLILLNSLRSIMGGLESGSR